MAFNKAKLALDLENAFKSVLNQNFKSFEIPITQARASFNSSAYISLLYMTLEYYVPLIWYLETNHSKLLR